MGLMSRTGMEYELLSEIRGRGGVEAVTSALEGFAGRASEEELDAAVDVACRVIADDTARIEAHADQQKARTLALEQETADVQWQIDMLAGFTIEELLESPDKDD
ncbi:hypothetical protein [Streptomyces mirabilis]|uniref:hypothetical protein n=1 Tax=Streptomyces mirabilis TaxID=68239 RepID=UPI0033D09C09